MNDLSATNGPKSPFQSERKKRHSFESFFLACIGGTISALTTALLIAAIVIISEVFHVVFLLISPVIVGITVRISGNGTSPKFGILGAVFSLMGSILGLFLITAARTAYYNNSGFLDELNKMEAAGIAEFLNQVHPALLITLLICVLVLGYLLGKRREMR